MSTLQTLDRGLSVLDLVSRTPAGLSIAEIASRVGYDDYSSFTKIFRQKMGMSPTEYRSAAAEAQEGN